MSEKPRSKKERKLSQATANSFEKSRSLADLRLAAAITEGTTSSSSVADDPNPERLL